MKVVAKKRTASKEQRQLQLIQATIRSIAGNGLSDTTMSRVSKEAGLSQGIINLHFQSKDNLLAETLKFVAEEYRCAWTQALADAGPETVDQLAALVAVDFDKTVCHPDKLAVWFAFWGESKARPTYRNICAARDRAYRTRFNAVITKLIEEGGYTALDAENVSTGLSAMGEGMWLDLLISPRRLSRETAKAVCMNYLSYIFPKHYPRPKVGIDRTNAA